MWLNDWFCDPACNVKACSFDGGDCAGVVSCNKAATCPTGPNKYGFGASWVGDCVCDAVCNVAGCKDPKDVKGLPDGGDCDAKSHKKKCGMCSEGCYNSWVGDGFCDILGC